jgi:hypothetical protein
MSSLSSKNVNSIIVMFFLVFLLLITSSNVSAKTNLSARDIVELVDESRRQTTDSAFTRMSLTTCKYGISKGKLKCAKKARIKVIESAQVNTGEDNKDVKSISIVLEPANERGIGMLSFSYDDTDRDNETWIYLSALGKVKRMSTSSSDDEDTESASLFGTEITIEDQETGKLDDFNYEILGEGKFRGREVVIIESTPKPHRLKKSRYGKTRSWIDLERFITLKVQMFDKNKKPIKQLDAGKVEKINDIWMSRSLTFMNLVTQRLTNMKIEAINFNIKIEPSFLTKRALNDQAFREKYLLDLREQAK